MKLTQFLIVFFISIKIFAQLPPEKYFFDNGNLNSQIIQLDSIRGLNQHIINYFENGQKKEDYFIRLVSSLGVNEHIIRYSEKGQKTDDYYYFAKNLLIYDTLKQWTEEGQLWHVEIYNDSGYTSIDYINYPNEVSQTGNYTVTYLKPKNSVIYDSATFNKYEALIERNVSYQANGLHYYKPYILRTGIWRTYHENGTMESEGKYLPMAFVTSYPSIDSSGISIPIKIQILKHCPTRVLLHFQLI